MFEGRKRKAPSDRVSRVTDRIPRIKGRITSNVEHKELKYVDTDLTSVCNTTGTVIALNLIAVGNDNTTRNGREVTIKSVQLLGIMQPFDNSIVLAHLARYMLVWDNAVNSGSIASISDILTSSSSIKHANTDNQYRFTILHDFKIGMSGPSAQEPSVIKVDMQKTLNLLTKYSGTTAAIGSIQNGALLFVSIGNTVEDGGGQGSIIYGTARVCFIDN